MKKLITVVVVSLVLFTVVFSQPAEPEEPSIKKTISKIDDETCEIITVTTSTSTIRLDRAVLQTELDHIPDRKAEIQKQLDVVNEREAELINILKVFD